MLEVNVRTSTMDDKMSIEVHISSDRKMYLDFICIMGDVNFNSLYMIRYSKDPNNDYNLYITYDGVKYPVNLRRYIKSEDIYYVPIKESNARKMIQKYFDDGNLELIALVIGGFVELQYRKYKDVNKICAEFNKYSDLVSLIMYCFEEIDIMNQKILKVMNDEYKLKLKKNKVKKTK